VFEAIVIVALLSLKNQQRRASQASALAMNAGGAVVCNPRPVKLPSVGIV
jgi:hypothetical protein